MTPHDDHTADHETGPAGAAADAAAGHEPDAVDDGMGADAPADVAGEDEAVPGLDDDPLARAHRA